MLYGQQTPAAQLPATQFALPQEVKLGEELTVVKITAAEAGRIAIDNSPALKLARALVLGAHGNTIEARSGLLPNVGLTSSGTTSDTIRGGKGGSNGGTGGNGSTGGAGMGNSGQGGISANLSVTQLLFDFGHTLALAHQALANEWAALHGLTRAEQDLVFQTKVAYYLFALNTELVGVQDSNVKDRKAQQDLAQARIDAGPGEPSDLLIAQTNTADAIQQLVLARSTALSSRIALAIAMGIDPRTPIAASDSAEGTLTDDFSVYYKQALASRPDLLQMLQQLKAAGFEVQAAKTNDAPVLNFNAGYNANGQSDPSTNQSASLGLSLTWAIFDGFYTRGKRTVAQADLDTARASLSSLQLTIGSDVSTAWSVLQYAEQRLPLVQGEQTIATESLRIAEGRYKAGIGAFINVTDAEASLVTAKQAVASAKNALSTARATLRHAVGGPK